MKPSNNGRNIAVGTVLSLIVLFSGGMGWVYHEAKLMAAEVEARVTDKCERDTDKLEQRTVKEMEDIQETLDGVEVLLHKIDKELVEHRASEGD